MHNDIIKILVIFMKFALKDFLQSNIFLRNFQILSALIKYVFNQYILVCGIDCYFLFVNMNRNSISDLGS